MQKQPVKLAGTSAEIASQWAAVNGRQIREHVADFLANIKRKKISKERVAGHVARFVAIAGKYGNHWLEEAGRLSSVCGIKPEIYIAYMAGVYRNLLLQGECTSYTVSKRIAADDRILFHKTRDNRKKAQSAFILHPADKGINKFIAVSDASVIGAMMMVNEKGLAGSADTLGSFQSGRPIYEGMMNVFILRYIAERAASCREAVEIVREFVRNRYYAGGAIDGTHWLFADRTGTAYEVSNNAVEVVARRIHEDFYISCRRKGIKRRYGQLPKPLSFEAFHSLSRCEGMCFESSIAGMTVEIDPVRPDVATCAWMALPAGSYALPLVMGGSMTPRGLLDGSVYTRGDAVIRNKSAKPLFEFFDRENHLAKDSLLKNLAAPAGARNKKHLEAQVDCWTRLQEEKYFLIANMLK